MKRTKEQGVTLVALVVTIIILIILAGVSINALLGDNGLITKAQQAKENMILAQVEEEASLNELYSQLENEDFSGDIDYDAIAKLSEFKKTIADYIGEAGGIKPDYSAEAVTFGESIKGIVKEVTKDATATAADILKGKTAWVNGNKVTGTQEFFKGPTNLNLITSAGITSNITTSSSTDKVKIDIANYNQLLILVSMGDYWHLVDGQDIQFKNILLNNENVWFYNKTYYVGGDGSQNGQVAYAVAIVNCIPNDSNELNITTKSVGTNFSVTKNYEIYGIEF